MTGVRLVAPGTGEVIGDSAERRVEILSEHPSLNATWSRFGPGRDGADLHVHRRHHDCFYVLDGVLTLRLGPRGEEVPVPAGTLARVPPLVVHGFRNAGDAELRYLNFHAPGERFADYMRAMRDGRSFSYDQEPPPADGGRSPQNAVIGEPADVEQIAVSERSDSALGRHEHAGRLESVYVLAGTLAIAADGRELLAPAGAWVQIAPGVPHALAPAGAPPARHLEVHTPARRGAPARASGDGAARSG